MKSVYLLIKTFKIENMKLTNLKPASDYEVEEWLESRIKNLTPYQKEWIRNEEIIR
jgi:hypothetical protein